MREDREDNGCHESGMPKIDEDLARIVGSLPVCDQLARTIIAAVPEAQALKAYLEDISRLPVLSESEETALVKSLKDSTDKTTSRRLNEANLRLVAWIAKEYAAAGAPLSDLINEGTIGLMQACQTYVPGQGTTFRLYAAYCIRKAISEAVAYETALSRVPAYLLEKVTSIKPISQRLMEKMGREPTRQEVAEQLGLTEDELDRLVKLVGHAPGNAEGGSEES